MMKSLKKMKRDVEAISPVIATLMLVVITVASVSAFYLWFGGWQADATDDVGDGLGNVNEVSLTITGSSTVFPLMQLAAEQYMHENTKYRISVASTGSGVGIAAAGMGTADIGMASKALGTADLAKYPDLVPTTIGWDAVVIIVDADNTIVTDADLTKMTSAIAKRVYGVGSEAKITTWQELKAVLNGAVYTSDPSDNAIVTYEREDVSGTEECFFEKILGDSKLNNIAAEKASGNAAMITAIAGNPFAIGFTSFGMAQASDSVDYFTALNGVTASTATILSGTYDGARPLNVLTNGTPQGEVREFINYLRSSAVNPALCSATGYVSLYA